jgi:hypothetical protein
MGNQPPVTRTFIHDVESLLWILVWAVAHRSQKSVSWEVNANAQELIQHLSQNNMRQLGAFKSDRLEYGGLLRRAISACDNDFSKALASGVGQLAEFFRIYFYKFPNTPDFDDLVEWEKERALVNKKEHELMMSESREATFGCIFAILDAQIERLKHHPIHLTKL